MLDTAEQGNYELLDIEGTHTTLLKNVNQNKKPLDYLKRLIKKRDVGGSGLLPASFEWPGISSGFDYRWRYPRITSAERM